MMEMLQTPTELPASGGRCQDISRTARDGFLVQLKSLGLLDVPHDNLMHAQSVVDAAAMKVQALFQTVFESDVLPNFLRRQEKAAFNPEAGNDSYFLLGSQRASDGCGSVNNSAGRLHKVDLVPGSSNTFHQPLVQLLHSQTSVPPAGGQPGWPQKQPGLSGGDDLNGNGLGTGALNNRNSGNLSRHPSLVSQGTPNLPYQNMPMPMRNHTEPQLLAVNFDSYNKYAVLQLNQQQQQQQQQQNMQFMSHAQQQMRQQRDPLSEQLNYSLNIGPGSSRDSVDTAMTSALSSLTQANDSNASNTLSLSQMLAFNSSRSSNHSAMMSNNMLQDAIFAAYGSNASGGFSPTIEDLMAMEGLAAPSSPLLPRFSALPHAVQLRIRDLTQPTSVLKIEDFDEKVTNKIALMVDRYGEPECMAMLDKLAGRLKTKMTAMRNGPGYLDVAVSSHLDVLMGHKLNPQSTGDVKGYARCTLPGTVYEDLGKAIDSNPWLRWEVLDESIIHQLKKLPSEIASERLVEVGLRSFRHVDNVSGCIKSILSSRNQFVAKTGRDT